MVTMAPTSSSGCVIVVFLLASGSLMVVQYNGAYGAFHAFNFHDLFVYYVAEFLKGRSANQRDDVVFASDFVDFLDVFKLSQGNDDLVYLG